MTAVRHCFRAVGGLYAKESQRDDHMEQKTQVEIRFSDAQVRTPAPWALAAHGLRWLCLVWICLTVCRPVRAALQFDVFVGHGGQPTGSDGIVREAGWFPVAVEVQNDGAPFNATFELSSSQMGGGQTRRMVVELPTNTRKRFVLAAFAGSATYST